MTLIQAQTRLITRVSGCHPGHRNRVRRAAVKELADYLKRQGMVDAEMRRAVIRDALDMAKLEENADE